MLVFVDESGDPGVRGRKDSSEFFVVTAVLFFDRAEAARCEAKIKALREELGWHPSKEFKFNKLSAKLRITFLNTVARYNFSYLSFVLNKKKLTGPGFNYKHSFYKYPVRMLFQNAKQYLEHACVIIDKCGEREFRQQLATYLKKHTNIPGEELSIKAVKMHDSHRDNLLQLADMVCGAVSRSLKSDKIDRNIYRNLILDKELHYQKWPS